jgi:hypothetical protein
MLEQKLCEHGISLLKESRQILIHLN